MPDRGTAHLQAALRAHFGMEQFRPLQQEIISEVLAGRPAMAILPTGGGKSLCYQLPALILPGVTLVISPLISLMKDQVDALVARGIRAIAINSQDTPAEGRAKLEALADGDVKLAFVAPERLSNSAFMAACRQVEISLLAVDEAHCVSQWGHDFRPDYRYIKEFHGAIGAPPLLALTATARPDVRDDAMVQLGIAGARIFSASANRENLWIGLEACATVAEKRAKIAYLARTTPGSVIIYASSRKECETLSDFLSGELAEAVAHYHAGMSADERTAVQNRFMAGLCRVVVATNAFGMGIDKADIRAVIHAGVPDSLEAYFQEIGRAGRDGLPSACTMVLVQGLDVKLREHLLRQEQAPDPVDEADRRRLAEHERSRMERFRRMRSFIYLDSECRRQFLLRYFGEKAAPQAEGCCSVCEPRPLPADLAIAAAGSRRKKRGAAVRSGGSQGAGGTGGTGGASGAGAPNGADGAGHPAQAILFERLREWRKRRAAEMGVPAFVVFGDKDLMGIAEAAPRSLHELAACRGLGPVKLGQYGTELLAEIAEALAAGPAATPEAPAPRVSRADMIARAGELFAGGLSPAEAAARLERAPSTVFAYFLDWVTADESGAWKQAVRHVISPDDYRAIRQSLRTHPDEGLGVVFAELGERYSYDQIKLTRVVMGKA